MFMVLFVFEKLPFFSRLFSMHYFSNEYTIDRAVFSCYTCFIQLKTGEQSLCEIAHLFVFLRNYCATDLCQASLTKLYLTVKAISIGFLLRCFCELIVCGLPLLICVWHLPIEPTVPICKKWCMIVPLSTLCLSYPRAR